MVYAGVQFRSTLEADWAATLDHANLSWSYEPDAVQLPGGDYYLPDFWLADFECWMEVKGPNVPGIEKAYELSTLAWVVIGAAPVRGRATWRLMDPPKYVRATYGQPDELPGWVDKNDQVCERLGMGFHDGTTIPFARAPRPARKPGISSGAWSPLMERRRT